MSAGDQSPEAASGRPDLSGRRALVTGAAVGIGRATAELLAACGAAVAAVDRDEAVSELTSAVGELEPVVADLSAPGVVDALCDRVAARGAFADREPVDLLVNCAATYNPRGGFLDTDRADWERLLAANVISLGLLARAMTEGLAAAHRRPAHPAIVNCGSVQEALPLPGWGPYVASKGAVTAATRALAVELGPFGIRVNAVSPGVIETPSFADTFDGAPADDGGPPTLLGRAGAPAEVAAVIAFLASDAASFVTGAVVPVDGGRQASRRPDPLATRTVGDHLRT